jgi:hypothetical protein
MKMKLVKMFAAMALLGVTTGCASPLRYPDAVIVSREAASQVNNESVARALKPRCPEGMVQQELGTGIDTTARSSTEYDSTGVQVNNRFGRGGFNRNQALPTRRVTYFHETRGDRAIGCNYPE